MYKNKPLMPSNWKQISFSELFDFKNGINADKEQFGKGVKVISVNEVLSENPIYYDSIGASVEVTEEQLRKFGVEYGDILFQRSSENYEDAGTANVYLDEEKVAVFGGFVIRARRKTDCNPVYLHYLLRLPSVRKEVIRKAAGAQHVNIGQDSLAKVRIYIATPAEQLKIAEILSTQDRVIELKEKRLAEKRQQKKYLMQVLLSGKKRLNGYTEDWHYLIMGNAFDERTETNCEGLELLSITGEKGIVPQSELDKKICTSEDKSKYRKICVGDIGYNTMRMWQGVSAYSEYEGIVSPAYTILKPQREIDARFFSYLFKLENVITVFHRHSQGLVDDTLNLKYEHFKAIKLLVPKSKQEQSKVAKILLAADRELSLLQADLDQERQKKKALMQLLLSGLVRVNVEGGGADGAV